MEESKTAPQLEDKENHQLTLFIKQQHTHTQHPHPQNIFSLTNPTHDDMLMKAKRKMQKSSVQKFSLKLHICDTWCLCLYDF